MEAKKVMILIRSAPYGMATAGEGFRALIGLVSMGIQTHVVLADDGVMVALKNQSPEVLDMNNLVDLYAQLPGLGAKLYLYHPSLADHGISPDDCIEAEVLGDEKLRELISVVDHVITFN